MSEFKIGNDHSIVKLAVDITSNGISSSRAFLISQNHRTAIPNCVSKDATGDIYLMPIGQSSILKGKNLVIITNIQLFWPEEETRKIEFENISAKYILNDGVDSYKEFGEIDFKLDVYKNFTSVWIQKTISLR